MRKRLFILAGAVSVIAIVAVVSCCNFPFVVPGTIVPGTRSFAFVDIGTKHRANPAYIKWKDKDQFDKALAQVRGHNGKICICVLLNSGGEPYRHELNNDCPDYHCSPENIRTVKVTKSKAADNIAAGESAANDPNVMHRVQSPDPGDISKVLAALKH